MKPIRVIIPIILILALIGVYYTRLTPGESYANTRDIKGDWVIDDYQLIEDTMLNIEGNILVEGEGHLVLRNCYMNFEQNYNNEFNIQAGSWEDEGVQKILDNIDYWRDAPLWTPEKIEESTKDWFKHLQEEVK